MASLNKLLIQGIRSFDPNQHEVIEFFPMTVIVGHNGSGKTVGRAVDVSRPLYLTTVPPQTIVEALRYATTGEQPPGSKGGFVHDPTVGLKGAIHFLD